MISSIPLSQEQFDVLIGGLLGDSSLKRHNTISFCHCDKQKDYLEWKQKILSPFSGDVKPTISKFNNKEFLRWMFHIGNINKDLTSVFALIRDLVSYNDGKKTVTKQWLDCITPLALAVWWMDDGSLSVYKGNRWGKLCTEAYTYDENILIRDFLLKQYDITSSIKSEKGKYYFIRIGAIDLRKLITIIYPYVIQIPSMVYKINMNYVNTIELGDFEYINSIIKSHTN